MLGLGLGLGLGSGLGLGLANPNPNLNPHPKTDLHQTKSATPATKHTTLSDEHNKPEANKELPAHPATTSKGAASYLESTKKVAAAS